MDHLLRPHGTRLVPASLISITYTKDEGEYYDDQGFVDYPTRCGWSEEDLMGMNNFGNRSAEKVETFFQSWLFFGIAIEILKAAGIRVRTQDFLGPGQVGTQRRVVNTEVLPPLLVKWKALWPLPKGVSKECTCRSWIDPSENRCHATVCWKSFEHAQDSDAWHQTSLILDRACQFTDRYCSTTGKTVWPVREEVATSILAMGFSLRTAAISIYDIPRMVNNWGSGSSPLLRRMLGQKWCKSDAALIMDDLHIDGQYYLAVSRSPSQEYLNAHSTCDESRCRSKVQDGTYVTLHAPGCDKDPGDCPVHFCYGPPSNGTGEEAQCWPDPPESPKFERDLVRVITAGGAVKAGENFDINLVGIPVITWDEETQEVTIAEFNVFKGLTPAYVAISHVWLDGMGNKMINSIPKCQLSRIQRMVDEIPFPPKQPGEKMGFWLDTLCVPVRKPFGDAKRWSIQRMRHIYKNAAAVLVLDSWLSQIPSEAPIPDRWLAVYMSNWQRRLWTFQEGCLADKLHFRFSDGAKDHEEMTDQRMAHDKELEARGIYGNFCGLSNSAIAIHFTLVKSVVARLVREASSSPDSIWASLWNLYLPMASALGHRQTTNLADETLCLSTILGTDPGLFLGIRGRPGESDEELAERRMIKFLQKIKTFNTGLIFGDYPRINVKGFGWAPRSLLSARHSTIAVIGDRLTGRLKRVGSYRGLVVRYPGIRCRLVDLLSANQGNAGTFSVSQKGAKGAGVYYVVEPKLQDGLKWDEQSRGGIFALLFPETPKAGEECCAMIGSEPNTRPSHSSSDSDSGRGSKMDIHALRYECNAVIRGVSGAAPPGTVSLPFYGRKTKWMVM